MHSARLNLRSRWSHSADGLSLSHPSSHLLYFLPPPSLPPWRQLHPPDSACARPRRRQQGRPAPRLQILRIVADSGRPSCSSAVRSRASPPPPPPYSPPGTPLPPSAAPPVGQSQKKLHLHVKRELMS